MELNKEVNEVECENDAGTDENIENKMVAMEERNTDSPGEMINLPDTFFDDLMDVEFLGSFDVVDSWKQDEDNADEKSEEKDKEGSSRYDDKGRRMHDNDRSKSDRTSRYDKRRHDGNLYRDWRDGKSHYSSRSRNERSRSHSKKDSTSTSRVGRDKYTSRTRKDRSTSRSRRRSASRHRIDNSTSRSRRGTSDSKSRRGRSTSRSRNDSSVSVRKEDGDNSRMNTTEIEGKTELRNVQANNCDLDNDVEDHNQKYSIPENNLPVKETSCDSLPEVSIQPAPPGLEEDIVPPGEEPILIRPTLETSEKDRNADHQKTSEKINPKENHSSDKNLSVEKQKEQSEAKNESGVAGKSREQSENLKRWSDVESRQRVMRTGRLHKEAPRNWDRSQGRSKEDLSSSRKRSPVDVDRRYNTRSNRPRSISAERDLMDRERYRSREIPLDSDRSIERDIRNFKWLRSLEKWDKLQQTDLVPERVSRERRTGERDDYHSYRELHKSRSASKLSLSPSLSPVRVRYSRSPSRSNSRARHRSRDYRHRRSYSRSNDSLKSMSFSLSSDDSRYKRRYSGMSRNRSSKYKPFYEEIAQKLGIPTDSPEHLPYPQQHEIAGTAQQSNAPYIGGLPHHLMQCYPGPPGPMTVPPPGTMVGSPQSPMMGGQPPGPVVCAPLGSMVDAPTNIHVPPPNLNVPPPTHHMLQSDPSLMVGLPASLAVPPPVSYPQPRFVDVPAPVPAPAVDQVFRSNIIIKPQPHGAAPPEPIFSAQLKHADPSSLSSYLEATMKGEAEVLQQPRDKNFQKAAEDNRLLSCVKPEVVKRCEEAVAAVRAENALSMVPLGRVIVQPKALGSSALYSVDEVSCFRSPLYNISNASFSFTTPPLHDFVSSNLKTAARKLRRSEQSKQLALRGDGRNLEHRLGDDTRRSTRSVSIGVNTEISCKNNEWCCKCQAYNLSNSHFHAPSKQGRVEHSKQLIASRTPSNHGKEEYDSQRAALKRKQPQHQPGSRGPRNSLAENSDDSDVQIISDKVPQSSTQPNPPKGILKRDTKPPEKTNLAVPAQSSKNPVPTVQSKVPIHSFSSFPHMQPMFQNMSMDQFQRFCVGFRESQLKFKDSFIASKK